MQKDLRAVMGILTIYPPIFGQLSIEIHNAAFVESELLLDNQQTALDKGSSKRFGLCGQIELEHMKLRAPRAVAERTEIQGSAYENLCEEQETSIQRIRVFFGARGKARNLWNRRKFRPIAVYFRDRRLSECGITFGERNQTSSDLAAFKDSISRSTCSGARHIESARSSNGSNGPTIIIEPFSVFTENSKKCFSMITPGDRIASHYFSINKQNLVPGENQHIGRRVKRFPRRSHKPETAGSTPAPALVGGIAE